MIFAPGIFFIVYLAMVYSGEKELVSNNLPPAEYLEMGQTVELDSVNYTVRSGKNIFTDRLELKNNVAIPEPGWIFMGLQLEVNPPKDAPVATLVDSEGRTYKNLDVRNDIISQNFNLENPDSFPYMFKVRDRSENYYFKINNDSRLVWRVPGSEHGK